MDNVYRPSDVQMTDVIITALVERVQKLETATRTLLERNTFLEKERREYLEQKTETSTKD